ncbi:F0F1 ATP synthase subunit gamma [uncultured Jatrophihabitans sp.]|uniref:F0F1 ATP synthase subunit gamma n=1 Tax=uncultured Jatrophihabitans sp. TaxID=1610747 RepID=UPI0035C9ED4C
MAAEIRVLRRRIRSVESTKKITKAMELIAASRIVRAQNRMRNARPYAQEIRRALEQLSSDRTLEHPMLTGVENPRRAGILVVTSDRGLAGGYNANALRRANELAERLSGEGKEIERYIIGRKGVVYYRFRQIELAGAWTGFSEQPNFTDARAATDAIVAALSATSEGEITSGEREGKPGIDELWIVFTRFVNSVTQTPVAIQAAPVNSDAEDDSEVGLDDDERSANRSDDSDGRGNEDGDSDRERAAGSYEFEPEPAQLIGALLPRYVSSRIFSALLESAASESAARRRAMKSASDNATELIKTYTRLANQARQAEITQEISEIVGGADALASAGSEQ